MFLTAGVEHIHVNQQHCLNSRIREVNCRKCETVCPKRNVKVTISDTENPVFLKDSCTGCGLCAAVCPAGAISTEYRLPEKLKLNAGAVELTCNKQQLDGGVDCLGMLDAYSLTYIGMKTESLRVVLDSRRCEACNPGIPAAIRQTVSTANIFLRKLSRPAIKFASQHGKPESVIGRRDLFAFCFSRARETLLNVLPLTLECDKSAREGLVELIAVQEAKDATFSSLDAAPLFWGARVDRKCKLCGICVRTCKKEALVLTADKKRQQVKLLHNQSKCIGCMACRLLCPSNSLDIQTDLSSIRSVGSRLPVVVASGKCCSRCGESLLDSEQLQCEKCRQEKTPFLQAIY